MLSIGKLSSATGVKVPTIRYYEQIGLLPRAGRSTGNQRLYDRPAVERLAFIRHARELGFSLEDIRELLALADDPEKPCAAADLIAGRQLAAVNARLRRLEALRDELQRMLAQCTSGRIADCRVIEVLGNHALCAHDHAEAAEA
ncbi:MerR family transcriptional regulator [Paracoccus sp. DMF]|uniref:MerR family transcriptional regulator n=1 Tax=Paracoccus sp. DMF TaxID=400837 RepID=UPI0021E5170A|nr:helix-turn-helix domain-containing protein [Paracoccus sp. DMF]MCV2448168.1 helix-turn-helix domain-containing protein [Paracoccus sp. DMF]